MNTSSVIRTSHLSPAEEFVNCVTHGVGLILSVLGAVVMAAVLGDGDSWRTAGCGIYLASMIAMYAMSTLSHTFQSPRLRSLFRALDQGVIYLLIAGTYTPFAMAYLSGAWLLLLVACWAVALWGLFSKVLFAYRVESVSMWPCILLGALPFASLPPLLSVVSVSALWWMILGVACYVLGLVFWVNDHRVRHFHAAWHLLVIAGSSFHFMGILLFVVLAR
jgi:hemolysin III